MALVARNLCSSDVKSSAGAFGAAAGGAALGRVLGCAAVDGTAFVAGCAVGGGLDLAAVEGGGDVEGCAVGGGLDVAAAGEVGGVDGCAVGVGLDVAAAGEAGGVDGCGGAVDSAAGVGKLGCCAGAATVGSGVAVFVRGGGPLVAVSRPADPGSAHPASRSAATSGASRAPVTRGAVDAATHVGFAKRRSEKPRLMRDPKDDRMPDSTHVCRCAASAACGAQWRPSTPADT